METKSTLAEQVSKEIIQTMNLDFLIKEVTTVYETSKDNAKKFAALSILNFVETIKISDTQLFLMTLKEDGDKTLVQMKKGYTFRMYEEFKTFNFHNDRMIYERDPFLYREFPVLQQLFEQILSKLQKDSYTLALMK